MDLMEYDDTDQEILNKFRERLGDLLTPDHTDGVLLRWLRAKNFNLTKAEENFRWNNTGRKFYRINTILDWYHKPEVIEKYEVTTFLGFAKDGSGVRYVKMDIDYYGFMHSLCTPDLILYYCYMMESDLTALKEETIKTGRKCDQIIYILDAQKLPINQFTYKCVIEAGIDTMRLLQDHYPEIWKYLILVNVTPIFNTFYNIFKPFLRENLARRIKVATKENTKELLRTYIDDDVLPAFLGGQRVDSTGDPDCKEFISQELKISEKYYLKNCQHLINLSDPGVSMTVINARRVFNHSFVLKESGKRIKLEFRTENGSIDFAFFFRGFGENSEDPEFPAADEYLDPSDERSNVEVMGVTIRCQSHFSQCEAICTTWKPGIYILQFDNTNSWFTSRKLFYRITLLPPENCSK